MISLHVVGCPRSGTTLLTEMMATCFRIDGSCDHEETIFKVSPNHVGIYLSKKPNDILWVDRIIDRDPDLYVIAMIRDPRAVICSIHQGHPGMYFCNYPVWKRAEKALARLTGHPRILLLRYEELVTEPDAVQKKIAEKFSFLQIQHPFSDFHLHARSGQKSVAALGGLRQVDRERIQGWVDHKPRLKEQVTRYPELLADLQRYSYEATNEWTSALNGVVAKKFPCRASDRKEWFKYVEQRIRFRGKIHRYLAARNL